MKNPFFLSCLLSVAIFGAGCALPSSQTRAVIPAPKPVETQPPARSLGFGKLPTVDMGTPSGAVVSGISAASNIAPNSAPAPTVPNAVPMMGTTKSATAIVGRPMPIPPPPQTPGTVSYTVSATLPTWPGEDDVLRARTASFPSSQIGLLAQATGLPTQVLGSDPQATSLSFSWKDTDDFNWSYDAVQRNVSFWKQDTRVYANANQPKTPPTVDDAEFLRVADAFLSIKGFAGVPHAPGIVETSGGITPMGGAFRMPCPVPMMGSAVKAEAAGTAIAEPAQTKPSIAPGEYYPCGFPQQVTVTYAALQNGRNVTDAGGWPTNAITITIDLTSKNVMSGSVQLARDVDASRYPLIDRDTAIKRLNAGGRNPIWPWGNGTDVSVRITSAELVLMRYDSWDEKTGVATYFIPALAGSGEVEYDKGNIQPYRTIISLVADDAFEPVNPTEPIPLPAETGGGSAGVAPAETGTVSPQ